MKKLLSILMLLVAIVTGASAADVITFAGATTKDSKTTALQPTISSSNSIITTGTCASTCSTEGYIVTTTDGKTTVLGTTTYYLSQPYQSGSKKYWKDAGASFYGTFTIPSGYTYVMKGINHALVASGSSNFTATISVKDATTTKYATSTISVAKKDDGATITSTTISLEEANWVTLSAGTYTINVVPSNTKDSSTGKYFGIAQVSITGDLAVAGPSLSVTPTTANAFTYVAGNGPSAAQEFTVNLSNSEEAVSATLDSENYEMSKTSDGTYASTAITDLANGSKVYVRLKSGLAKGTGYDGTLTFANDDVTDDVVVDLSGSVTGVAYAISTTTPSNGSITASATSAPEGDEITLTATPDFRYALSAWNVYKTGEPATTVTVTNNKFTMPAYAVTVDATFAADTKKQVLYVTSDGNVDESDDLYAALSEDYTVTVAANSASKTVADFDLVVLHESIGGKDGTSGLAAAAKAGDVPVLNTKSYFYSDGKKDDNRWAWGLPNAGKTVNGCSQNAAYSNIASHPIFDGVEVTDGFVQVVTTAADKAMQPVGTIVAGKEGYVLATSPNASSGKGAAIHELTAAERGVASAKYIMISVSNASLNDLTANGQLLFKNAAAYLMSDEAWTPTLATTNITLNAKGYGTYSKANDFTFSGAKAYKMALDESAKTITGTEVTGKIVAGEGILFKGEPNAEVTVTGATWATALEDNSLKGSTKADGTTATKPTYCYVLSGDTFMNYSGESLTANKAYIQADSNLANSLDIVFEGDPTAVEAIAETKANAEAPVKVIKNGQLYIGNYNVAGARIK